jgi:site-specific DNA recombinase
MVEQETQASNSGAVDEVIGERVKPKAIALCRVSTAKQRTEGSSLEAQEQSVRQMNEELGSELIREWSLDVSSKAGMNINRKDLEEIRQYVKSHRGLKYFLVDRVSRLMREADRFIWFCVELQDRGVEVLFCAPDQRFLNGPDLMSKMMRYFMAVQAEQENKERASVNKQKMQAKVAEGYFPFRSLLGYMATDVAGFHVPDPKTAPHMQHILLAILSGEMTPSQAARYLNDNHCTTSRGGNPIDTHKLMKALKNPYYAGAIRITDWPSNESGLHQPLITMPQWERLQDVIAGRKKKFEHKKDNPEYPFNLTSCTKCSGQHNGMLVGFNQNNGNGWRRKVYRCRNCKLYMPLDVLHDNMKEKLDSLKLDETKRGDFIAGLAIVWERHQQNIVAHIRQLRELLDRERDAKDRMVERWSSTLGGLTDDLEEAIERKKLNIKRLKDQLDAAQNIQKDLVEFIKFSLGYAENLREHWWELNRKDRAECEQLLFPAGISVSPEAMILTPEVSVFFRLAKPELALPEDNDARKLLLVVPRGIEPLFPP